MTPRQKAKRVHAGKTPPARARASRGQRAWWLAGAFVLCLVVWSALSMIRAPERPASAPPAQDPAAAMSPGDAYDRAVALMREHRDLESISYYQRAIAGVNADFYELHYNYGSALYNLTRQFRFRHGVQFPLLRSTWEQDRTMAEALRQLDLATRLAKTKQELSLIESRYAQIMEVGGLPWDAFVAYRQAQRLDSTRVEIAQYADRYMQVMESPAPTPVR